MAGSDLFHYSGDNGDYGDNGDFLGMPVDRRKIGKDFQVAWIFLLVLQMSFVSLVERDRQIEKP